MGTLTKDRESADAVAVDDRPDVRASDASLREAEAEAARLEAERGRLQNIVRPLFPLTKAPTELERLEAEERLPDSAKAAATAKLKALKLGREHAARLAEARASLTAARLPQEKTLRRAQFRKLQEARTATEALYAHLQETRRLVGGGVSPVAAPQEAVPFAELMEEKPFRESRLDSVAADLAARGIELD
jgi:hypothetical protein